MTRTVTSSSPIRWWELLGAVLAGISWPASVVVGWASAQLESLLFWVYAIAWLGTLGGLMGLYARQASGYVWAGTSSFFAAFLGATLALAGTLLNLLYRSDLLEQGFQEQALGLGLLITLIGIVLFGVGFTLLGVASLLGRTVPLWCAVAIIVGGPVTWLLGGYGPVALGVVWLVVGYALWPGRDDLAAQQTS